VQFGECLSFISCNFLHQLRNITLKFLAAPINSSLFSITNCKMFSTNFPTDSNRFITDSTKGRKILLCYSSQTFNRLRISSKKFRINCSLAIPCPPFWHEWPRWMMFRDFKSAGVGTGKFVECVCRRYPGTWFLNKDKRQGPETRVPERIMWFCWMNINFLNKQKFVEWIKFFWINIKFLNENSFLKLNENRSLKLNQNAVVEHKHFFC